MHKGRRLSFSCSFISFSWGLGAKPTLSPCPAGEHTPAPSSVLDAAGKIAGQPR